MTIVKFFGFTRGALMKLKSVQMCLLFDFYGEMLTNKQRLLFDLYYNQDMSLAEISENVGITRQAVRDSVVNSEQILSNIENKLGLVAKYGKLRPVLNNISDSVNSILAINSNNYNNGKITSACNDILASLSRASEFERQ